MSTPALFDCDGSLRPQRMHVELVGRDERRLRAVQRASVIVGSERGARPNVTIARMDDVAASLTNADVVLVQIRPGGYAARGGDERFPHRYDLCGDEGLGPGGLAAAWRTWPVLAALLETIDRFAPAARVLVLTSPVGILSRLAIERFSTLRVSGICELPWTTLDDFCRSMAVPTRDVSYAYAGVNHLGWFSDIRTGAGRALREAPLALKYVRLHDEPANMLREQRARAPRATELAALAERAFDVYERGAASDVIATIRARDTPWYRAAVSPLLGAIANHSDASELFFLTGRNAGYVDWLDADDVIEMPYALEAGTPVRAPGPARVASAVQRNVSRLVAYERIAARAVAEGDATLIQSALRAHPWLDGKPVSRELVDDVIGYAAGAAAASA